ncbi:PspA/IM30 family protein [Candidatus Sumerlaeota bacterium]|nr:PspA/IM30 family protein [Candidatus Sumerlaeota bacterium]
MGIFSRISDVIRANLNDLLDRVEDPEKMIKQVILEMEANIQDGRGQVARAIAAVRRLEGRIRVDRATLDRIEKTIGRALEHGDDDEARDVIRRKMEAEEAATHLEEQLVEARARAQKMKTDLRALEDKVQEARRKRDTLIARKRLAVAQKDLNTSAEGFARAFRRAGRMQEVEDRLAGLEAEAEAYDELLFENGGPLRALKRKALEHDVEVDLSRRKQGRPSGETS